MQLFGSKLLLIISNVWNFLFGWTNNFSKRASQGASWQSRWLHLPSPTTPFHALHGKFHTGVKVHPSLMISQCLDFHMWSSCSLELMNVAYVAKESLPSELLDILQVSLNNAYDDSPLLPLYRPFSLIFFWETFNIYVHAPPPNLHSVPLIFLNFLFPA